MEAKTNAMRILDKLKVSYKHYQYDADKAVSGAEVCCQIEEILCFYVAGIIRA